MIGLKITERWANILNNIGYASLGIGAIAGIFSLFAPAATPTIATVVFTVAGVALTYVAGETKSAINQTKLDDANSAIRLANQRADEAVSVAHQERDARVEIERRLSDRTLTPVDEMAIAASAAAFPGQTYDCATFWDLREPLALTNKVHHVLQQNGWVYLRDNPKGFLLGGLEGIEIYSHPNAPESTRNAAENLATTLTKLGLQAKRKDMSGETQDHIALNFGTKPV